VIVAYEQSGANVEVIVKVAVLLGDMSFHPVIKSV
jgi:hypothetical protein